MSGYSLNGLLRMSKGQEAKLFVFILSGNHHICLIRLSNHDLLVWLWKVYISLVVWMNHPFFREKILSSDCWNLPFLESLKIKTINMSSVFLDNVFNLLGYIFYLYFWTRNVILFHIICPRNLIVLSSRTFQFFFHLEFISRVER